ncbi:MAG: sugar ABC transporter substrate-binding protein [Candidatus Atribacteria bacterium]|nr:sugar ABC transporter substrate-binding protein [Candidatus Atribacteria bacterium]
MDWNVFSEPVLREKVVADLAAKTGTYDIFLLDGWQTARYARAGYVAPLDDLLANKKSKYYCEDFAPIFLDALRYEGKLWGLPYYGHVGILMYRKDQFTEKGIDVPKTTDDLMNAAAKLTDKANNKFGMAMRAVKGEDNPIISTSWTWVFGGQWLDKDMKPGVTSPEFIKGATWFTDLLKNYGPPDVSRYSWLEVQNTFVTGNTSIIFDASDFIGRIEDPTLSQIVGKIGYALAPAGPFGPITERYPSHLFTAGMAINADSKNVDASWLFLQWMTSKDIQMRTMMEGGNTGIASLSAIASDEYSKTYPGIPVILEALKLANPNYMPHVPEYPELCEAIGTQISRAVTGEITAEEAMKTAYDEMYKVMDQAGYYKK